MESKLRIVDEHGYDQRLDNYLMKHLKGVPKTRIYRAIRTGEVRVNKRRVKADYRLQVNDAIRLPPLRVTETKRVTQPNPQQWEALERCICYEDDDVLIMNKPAGMSVHAGSGITMGLIEILRASHSHGEFLELVHRLDRDTSGCLLLAKNRAALLRLHQLLIHQAITKQYLLLVKGRWPDTLQEVALPLQKNVLKSGERMVMIHEDGKPAVTRFRLMRRFKTVTLLEARPLTGRTHQIRVHAAQMGYPIVGDEKYGDANFNKQMRRQGIKRLFLHSAGLSFPFSQERHMGVCVPLEANLWKILEQF